MVGGGGIGDGGRILDPVNGMTLLILYELVEFDLLLNINSDI